MGDKSHNFMTLLSSGPPSDGQLQRKESALLATERRSSPFFRFEPRTARRVAQTTRPVLKTSIFVERSGSAGNEECFFAPASHGDPEGPALQPKHAMTTRPCSTG
jgi:hypothetical protein